MSKVKKDVIEAAVVKLMADITATMPTPAHKFLLGSMQAVAALNGGKALGQLLNSTADGEGYVDLDQVKAAVYGGFDAAGGKVSFDLFKSGGGLMSMFVKPVTLTVTKDDVAKLLAEVEQSAIQDVKVSDAVALAKPVAAIS